MDLDRYVEDELAEERALGHASADAQRGNGLGYPGDVAVEVAADAIGTEVYAYGEGALQRSIEVHAPLGCEGGAPGVIVIHENKGLVPYITNVARRFAQDGYVALAPDLLAPLGGTESFATTDAVTEALRTRTPDDLLADLRTALTGLAAHPLVDPSRLAVVGFCFGGGLAWRLLAAEDSLAAGVPFYGPPPSADEFARISVPVLAIYGETDERITSTLAATTAAMAGRPFEALVLEGAGHAFHNDTNPDRYDPEASRRAWEAAGAFLRRVLG
jgi:carboxymethylenebutenolidase